MTGHDIRVIVGPSAHAYPGWIQTRQADLDLTKRNHWIRRFNPGEHASMSSFRACEESPAKRYAGHATNRLRQAIAELERNSKDVLGHFKGRLVVAGLVSAKYEAGGCAHVAASALADQPSKRKSMTGANRPNILFIMSDDHAAHAISAYGSRINETPHIDRIATEGAHFDNCFCTNSICAPSRAVILTGRHSHLNAVLTLADDLDGRQETFPQLLQAAGYQTAIFGKWHLGHGGHADPTGFDHWAILPDHGIYHNTNYWIDGELTSTTGYVTDQITDMALEWLGKRDRDRPFMALLHHKAPHRPWEPDDRHARMYEDIDIPLPATFDDDYSHRSNAARNATMRIESDLNLTDLKEAVPDGLTADEAKHWKYQRYIKDYLRCVASIDDNVGRTLDYLDAEDLAQNTVVIYTSDQGFFLGDHGWYDKRFMYEESLRMPLLMRYPKEIPAESVIEPIVSNLDIARTILDFAGIAPSGEMQGRSIRDVVAGYNAPDDWPTSFYYRYWMHLTDHGVPAHYGIRTQTHKLIYYYGEALGTSASIETPTDPEWELFDLVADPLEMRNVYDDPTHASIVRQLKVELQRLKAEALDNWGTTTDVRVDIAVPPICHPGMNATGERPLRTDRRRG